MARIDEVIAHLRPDAEWVMHNDSIDELIFLDAAIKPITKAEFDNGLKDLDAKKANAVKINAEAKTALLERLGITADEATLLLA